MVVYWCVGIYYGDCGSVYLGCCKMKKKIDRYRIKQR